MSAIAKAYVEVEPDLKGFSKDLEKQVGDAADNAGKKGGGKVADAFGKAAKAGLAIGAVAIGAFAANAVSQASNLGESINAVNVTFGDAAAGVLKLGEDAATAVGLSNSEFNGLAVQFSAFATTVAGEGGNVSGTLDDLTTRSADFASVMNIDVKDAAGIFQAGLAGETDGLKKFGIDLSGAAVEAYAMANGIGEAGRELTEQEKVQARYGALMEQTAKTQGDFANTSGSFANQQRILKAQFADMSAEVGAVLIPIMSSLFSILLAALPTVKAAFLGVFDAVKAVIGFIGDNRAAVIAGLTAFAIVVGTVLVPMFIAWATAASASAIATIAAAAPLVLIGVAIAAVAAGLVWAYQNVDIFRNAIDAVASFLTDVLWPAIQTAFQGALNVVTSVIGAIVPIIETAFSVIAAVVTTYITIVRTIIEVYWAVISAVITTAMSIIVPVIETAWAVISTVIGVAMDIIRVAIEVAWTIISTVVTTYVNIVRTVIETVFGLLVGIVTGIWNGISGATQTAWNLIKTYVLGPVQSVRDTIGGVVSAIASTINGVWDGISSHASELWGKISGFVEGGINDIVGFVTGLPGRITSAVSGAFDGIGKAFRSAVNVVIDAWNGLSLRFKGGPWDPLGSFGPTIPAVDFGIDTPNIPRLAQGGITNGPMLAMLGDNRSGREAIVPLERAGEMGFGGKGPVVSIENANFYDGTDADLVAQRTVAAMSAMQLAG